jgi:hypothetical protein
MLTTAHKSANISSNYTIIQHKSMLSLERERHEYH